MPAAVGIGDMVLLTGSSSTYIVVGRRRTRIGWWCTFNSLEIGRVVSAYEKRIKEVLQKAREA